mmetsp:Transcript_13857/g.23641  ORF Transcript_13857/g.23641 Transcript_13857/m.23641 type:complete len:216 (-) Transcript_13857:441-1088(-)
MDPLAGIPCPPFLFWCMILTGHDPTWHRIFLPTAPKMPIGKHWHSLPNPISIQSPNYPWDNTPELKIPVLPNAMVGERCYHYYFFVFLQPMHHCWPTGSTPMNHCWWEEHRDNCPGVKNLDSNQISIAAIRPSRRSLRGMTFQKGCWCCCYCCFCCFSQFCSFPIPVPQSPSHPKTSPWPSPSCVPRSRETWHRNSIPPERIEPCVPRQWRPEST